MICFPITTPFILLSLKHASLTSFFFGRVFAYASGFPNRLSVTLKRSPYQSKYLEKKKLVKDPRAMGIEILEAEKKKYGGE